MLATLVVSFLLGGAEITNLRKDFSSMDSCQKAINETLSIRQKDASLELSCRNRIGTETKDIPKDFKYVLKAVLFNGYYVESELRFKYYDNLKDCERYMKELSSMLESISNNPSISYCLPEEF